MRLRLYGKPKTNICQENIVAIWGNRRFRLDRKDRITAGARSLESFQPMGRWRSARLRLYRSVRKYLPEAFDSKS